jgi:Lrp/AsnC family leucine-responsive transcriptional regulator
LDFIDKQILLALLNNCRITYQELATNHDISSNAIKKRIDKMENTGVIESYAVELSLAMVDAEFAMFFVSTNGTEDSTSFIKELGQHETINYVGELSGSVYIIFCSYQNGSVGLGKVTTFLRVFPFVSKVDTYPVFMNRGKKKDFSTQELLVLRELLKNPREAVSSIATKTSLPARVIKKVLDDFKTNDYVQLTIRWNLNAGDTITILERIEFDEKITSLDQILAWLANEFQKSYLLPLICSTLPVLYAAFVLDQLNEISEIESLIKKHLGLISVVTYIGKPSKVFPDIKLSYLKKLLSEKI